MKLGMKGPEMDLLELPFWLTAGDRLIFSESDGDDDGDDDGDNEEEGDDDDDNVDDKKPKEDDPAAGLKSALQKERAERKRLEKEAKALRKFKETEENKNKSATEQATEAATKATEAAKRLAAKLNENAVNTEIIKFAGKLGFADVDDAIALVKRSDIEVEQDEDDPSSVEVDSDSVEKALKALAKKKPHLLAKSSDDEEDEDDDEKDGTPPQRSTGSKVGSRGTRDKGKLSEEKLRQAYPALRR